jgi:hypothetical protein
VRCRGRDHPPSKIQNPKSEVDRLCVDLFLSPAAQEQDANLIFVRDRLLKHSAAAALLDLYDLVCREGKVHHNTANQLIDILLLSGLVRSEGGQIIVRNRIYARVFNRDWIRDHMPDGEQARQRAAFRRGALYAARALFVLFAVAFGRLSLIMLKQIRRAEEAQQNTNRLRYAANMNNLPLAWAAGAMQDMDELLEEAQQNIPDASERGFEYGYWHTLYHLELLKLSGHTGAVISVTFSQDGKQIVTGSEDKTAKVWNSTTGQERLTLNGHIGTVYSTEFSQDGKQIVTGSEDKTAKIWDAATGRCPHILQGHAGEINSCEFSCDSKFIVTASADHTARVWDTQTGSTLITLLGHTSYVNSAAFSPDGKRVVTSSLSR